MKPTRLARWVGYGAVIALALTTVRQAERVDAGMTVLTVQVPDARAERTTTRESPVFPAVDLTQLRDRPRKDPGQDPFSSRGWGDDDERESPREVAAPAPPPPAAPPLPFSFFGKLVEGDKTTVFVAKGDRNYVVRSGDTIDGHYRVEEIDERTMTFAYLPLGTRQTLTIGSAATPLTEGRASPDIPAPLAADAPPTHDLGKLVWIAPSEIPIGEEFTVEVGLPAGVEPRSGRLELLYDRLVLALLGGATEQGAANEAMQRAIVEVIGPGFRGGQPTPSEVRFRVLAAMPTNTQIRLENLMAKLATGAPLLVDSPKAHQLAIVEPARK